MFENYIHSTNNTKFKFLVSFFSALISQLSTLLLLVGKCKFLMQPLVVFVMFALNFLKTTPENWKKEQSSLFCPEKKTPRAFLRKFIFTRQVCFHIFCNSGLFIVCFFFVVEWNKTLKSKLVTFHFNFTQLKCNEIF